MVATATHTSPEIALLKSLEELCQSYHFAYYHIGFEKEKIQGIKSEEIDSLHKHFFYYSTGRRSNSIDFIAQSGESICLSSLVDYSKDSYKENLEYVIKLLKDQGQCLYVTEVTKPEFQANGFYVLKAIIPEYLDLAIVHRFRKQSNERLRKYQDIYGYTLNDFPHPFP